MYKVRAILLAALLFSATANATLYDDRDEFTGERHQETGLRGGFKGVNELGGGSLLSIVPAHTTLADQSNVYKLKLQWDGPELLLQHGAILRLRIDGELLELKADGTVNHLIETLNTGRPDVRERAEYTTTAVLIQRIAAAKSVDCALYTPRGRLERNFNRGNFRLFKEFVEKMLQH